MNYTGTTHQSLLETNKLLYNNNVVCSRLTFKVNLSSRRSKGKHSELYMFVRKVRRDIYFPLLIENENKWTQLSTRWIQSDNKCQVLNVILWKQENM